MVKSKQKCRGGYQPSETMQNVGAAICRPKSMQIKQKRGEKQMQKNHKGITLIALIITIIVMIILVGVTVTVALNGGLFTTAKQAAEQTQYQADYETLQAAIVAAMASEEGITQSSLQENLPSDWTVTEVESGTYTVKSPNGNEFTVEADGSITIAGDTTTGEDETITLPDGWRIAETPEGWDNENITAVTDGENTIPLPDGYEISDVDGENTIEDGLVIKDSNGNEFVWIPVSEDFSDSYGSSSALSEPKELTYTYSSSGAAYDSQTTLDYLYGEAFYDYKTDFDYNTHYVEMVASVNKYRGFYIGRYETTVDDDNNIGSVYNTTVITGTSTIEQTNYEYARWYGLYYVERNSDVTGNGEYVQTNMIWGQQWDAMITYFDDNGIDYSAFTSTQGELVKSGQSTNSDGENDMIYNIYDLRINGTEWTAFSYESSNYFSNRVTKGGNYSSGNAADYSPTSLGAYGASPTLGTGFTSRLTLYIK